MPFSSNFQAASDQAQAQQALNVVKLNASTLRRQNIQKRIDYYFGVQDAYLEKEIDKQFTYPDRLKIQREYFNCTQIV